MQRKPSQISSPILPTDPVERIMFFFSAFVVGMVLAVFFGCATTPPPPREITCLLRAPKPLPSPDPIGQAFPATESEPGVDLSGALECYNPATGKGFTIPFGQADKYVCKPPAGAREQDLYYKLRGL